MVSKIVTGKNCFYRFIKNIKYSARVTLGRYPCFYHLFKFHPFFRKLCVYKKTSICIEGFPRSGNSFFTVQFLRWNKEKLVAHHIHVPAQVTAATKHSMPCIVLFRNPLHAIASLMVMDERLSLSIALKSYIDFYSRIIKFRHAIILCAFETAINSPHEVIKVTNKKYSCSFKYQQYNQSLSDELMKQIRQGHKSCKDKRTDMLPNQFKDENKKRFYGLIQLHPLYHSASMLYEQLNANKDV